MQKIICQEKPRKRKQKQQLTSELWGRLYRPGKEFFMEKKRFIKELK